MESKQVQISFRAQLILMMVTIVSIMLVMVALYLEYRVNPLLNDKAVAELVQEVRSVSREAAESVLEIDDKAANELVQRYRSDPSVEVAAILLPDGSLLGFYSKLNDIALPSMDVSTPLVQTEDSLVIVEPIYYKDKIVGYVHVNHNSNALTLPITDYVWFLFALALLMLTLSFLLSNFFQGRLTKPIKQMVKHISNMYESKSFDKRLVAGRDDEIGKLVNGFNQLLDATQERENELTAKSNQLQKLVDVRTKQLFQKAHYDSLTGLPNRYLLVDRLRQAISQSNRNGTCLALLFLDLDRFKVINDNFGHQNGDQLLKEVAKRLKNISRQGDTIARLGGDEFVFLLENMTQPKDAARSALKIIECFNEPFRLQDHVLHISTSIGISVYPSDGKDDKQLLKNADISMYHAKKKGLGNFCYYSEEMNDTSLKRLAIEANLRNAIQNNELRLVFQPQLRLSEFRYRNVEALARWENPELGHVSPGVFIPIAEETGLIKQIDLWVISESCKQIRKWNDQGLNYLTVAINVSAGHLISHSLLEHLKTEIIVNDIRAEQIEIEITEEVFVEQTERTIQNLKAIKKLGARIAIDDFGTGYSSLQYIRDFPADTLKLDGMFIRNLESDNSSQGIVQATIILAHSLGLELVAECVEDKWQLDFLRENDCDIIQGYYLSEPLNANEIPAICRKNVF